MPIAEDDEKDTKKGYAVLLHGMGRNARFVAMLGKGLSHEGFTVVNLSYPSKSHRIEILGSHYLKAMVEGACPNPDLKIHFVTHSMGGLVLRSFLMHHRPANLGRVVMLAPPNRGSEIVDRLRSFPPYRWVFGPAGCQMETGSAGISAFLPPADFEVGIIAGRKCSHRIFSGFLPHPNDGRVSVESTRLEGMTDFLCLEEDHDSLVRSTRALEQVCTFLKTRRFSPPHTGFLFA